MNKQYFSHDRGFGLLLVILVVAVVVIGAAILMPNLVNNVGEQDDLSSSSVVEENENGDENAREAGSPAGGRAACEAACREQYGGSGSAGFDACIRACGAGETGGARVFPETNNVATPGSETTETREEACPSPGPACPTPQIAECKNGKWICIGPATGVN